MKVVGVAKSVNGVPVRVTEERWLHVIQHHSELEPFLTEVLSTVAEPDALYLSPPSVKPNYAAVRSFPALVAVSLSRNLVVHYREISSSDGFILTAMVMSDGRLQRRFGRWRRLR